MKLFRSIFVVSCLSALCIMVGNECLKTFRSPSKTAQEIDFYLHQLQILDLQTKIDNYYNNLGKGPKIDI